MNMLFGGMNEDEEPIFLIVRVGREPLNHRSSVRRSTQRYYLGEPTERKLRRDLGITLAAI